MIKKRGIKYNITIYSNNLHFTDKPSARDSSMAEKGSNNDSDEDPIDKLGWKGLVKWLRNKFTSSSNRLDSIEKRLISIDEKFNQIGLLRKDLANMEDRLNNMEERLSKKMDDMEHRFSEAINKGFENQGTLFNEKIDSVRSDIEGSTVQLSDRLNRQDQRLQETKDDIKSDIKYIIDNTQKPKH